MSQGDCVIALFLAPEEGVKSTETLMSWTAAHQTYCNWHLGSITKHLRKFPRSSHYGFLAQAGRYELLLSCELGHCQAEVLRCPHPRCQQRFWANDLQARQTAGRFFPQYGFTCLIYTHHIL